MLFGAFCIFPFYYMVEDAEPVDREAECISNIETTEFPDRFAVVLREIAESKMARTTPKDLV